MPPKYKHECERCGLMAEFERAGRFRDEDFYELLQEFFTLEQQLGAALHHANTKLERANERIDNLRELVVELNQEQDVPEFIEDEPENPFP